MMTGIRKFLSTKHVSINLIASRNPLKKIIREERVLYEPSFFYAENKYYIKESIQFNYNIWYDINILRR